MHFASTLCATCCSRPDVIEYLRAVISDGKTTLKTAYRFIGERARHYQGCINLYARMCIWTYVKHNSSAGVY